jgi:hypothetical protein
MLLDKTLKYELHTVHVNKVKFRTKQPQYPSTHLQRGTTLLEPDYENL